MKDFALCIEVGAVFAEVGAVFAVVPVSENARIGIWSTKKAIPRFEIYFWESFKCSALIAKLFELSMKSWGGAGLLPATRKISKIRR